MRKAEAKFKSVEAEIATLDEYYPNSDLKNTYELNRKKLIAIIEAFHRLHAGMAKTEEDLSILESGLSESWNVTYFHHVGKYLSMLAPTHSQVYDLLLRAICHKSWVTRRNVVDIIDGFSKPDVVKRILVHGLNDKSKKVFDLAVDKILRHHLEDVDLLATLENKIADIAEPDRRLEFQQQIELYRKGYRITKNEDGRHHFLIVKDSSSRIGFSLTEHEFMNIEHMGDYIEKMRKE